MLLHNSFPDIRFFSNLFIQTAYLHFHNPLRKCELKSLNSPSKTWILVFHVKAKIFTAGLAGSPQNLNSELPERCGSAEVQIWRSATFYGPNFRNLSVCPQYCGSADQIYSHLWYAMPYWYCVVLSDEDEYTKCFCWTLSDLRWFLWLRQIQ